MSFVPDLEAYRDRVGLTGPLPPTLATLRAIAAAHVRAIPFENLDVLLGRAIELAPAAVEQKLVRDRRGGYCFEQNTLLLHVLAALGFAVTPLSARVRWQRPRDYTPARTHLCVRVELDGVPWLCDVGIGAMSPTAPLRLDREDEQATSHEPRRIVRDGRWDDQGLRGPEARLFHQVKLAGAWQDVYDFTLEEMPEIDRIVASWYTSAHPQSHFKDRLIVARATDDGRIALVDRELTVRDRDGRPTTRTLAGHDELLAVLAEHFGVRLPAGTRFVTSGLEAWG
jgi:N-hydroxyarylamine O-acetyltransferase